jgi:hypothetical protein
VHTTDWLDVGVYVLKFSAQQKLFPQWNPVSTKYVYITITIEMLHEIGKATPTTHTFDEPTDQVSSVAVVTAPPSVYCGPRTYSMDIATDVSKVQPIVSDFVEIITFDGPT